LKAGAPESVNGFEISQEHCLDLSLAAAGAPQRGLTVELKLM
jgi:hypothetical protein